MAQRSLAFLIRTSFLSMTKVTDSDFNAREQSDNLGEICCFFGRQGLFVNQLGVWVRPSRDGIW